MPVQENVLEMFLALSEGRQVWHGALLLGVGLNEVGRATALASLAAGAAGLFLESDHAEHRQAQREGCCSFSVTTLEEAIRVLKNEVRQGRGVTVALSGDPSNWIAEIVERGLQPQAITFARVPIRAEEDCYNTLVDRGSQVLQGLGLAAWPGALDLGASLGCLLGGTWCIEFDTALTVADRRNRDQGLLEVNVSTGDGSQGRAAELAEKWLRMATSLFPRALERAWLRHGTAT